jgi:hypothetical protein
VNGAQVSETWPIGVANRPPARVSSPNYVATPHRYDPTTARYLADATVATWADPDGDPLTPTVATGSSACSTYEVNGGEVVVHCSESYPGAPLLASIVGTWTVSTGVADPWAAPAPLTTIVDVQNTGPRLIATSATESVSCLQGACCRKNIDGICTAWYQTFVAEVLAIGNLVTDDNGDPLNVTVNGLSQSPSMGASYPVSGWVPDRGTVCGNGSVTDAWTVQVSDAGGSASGTVNVTRHCL